MKKKKYKINPRIFKIENCFTSLTFDTFIDFNEDSNVYYYNGIFTISMSREELDKVLYNYSFEKLHKNDIINPYD